MRTFTCLSLGAIFVLAAACSDSPPAGAGMGGTTASAGSTASSGAGGAATSGGAAAVAGSSSAAGAGGSTGGASGAGSAGAGTSGATAGGGMSGSGGGLGDHTPTPSKGCGKLNPATGGRTIMTGGESAMYNVNLPAGYDASKPLPLGFGFHGFGNGACGPMQGECRGFALLPAVTVYMKSIGQGWEQGEVLEKNVTYWQDVLAVMKDEYCIDESRIFIAGVSSGGQFIEHLTCRFGDTLWQTTAVSAGVVGAATNDCKGTPAALVIHGITDQVGNYGQGVAEMFAKRNGCAATAPAGLPKAKEDMQAARDAEQAKHVCLDWDACTLSPVRYCLSSQITYDDLTHGWPMVGGTLIGEFQATVE
jgi:polyhydroxybutyrate depolymerase